jgi:acyl carrier protein
MLKMIDNMQLKEVVSNVLGVPVDLINDDTSPDTIDKWDSLSHLNLVMAIEAEFDVELTPEDSMDMLSFKLIRMILSDALNN